MLNNNASSFVPVGGMLLPRIQLNNHVIIKSIYQYVDLNYVSAFQISFPDVGAVKVEEPS